MGNLLPNPEATLSPKNGEPLISKDGTVTALQSAKGSQESQRRKPAFSKPVDSKTSGGKSEKWAGEQPKSGSGNRSG